MRLPRLEQPTPLRVRSKTSDLDDLDPSLIAKWFGYHELSSPITPPVTPEGNNDGTKSEPRMPKTVIIDNEDVEQFYSEEDTLRFQWRDLQRRRGYYSK